MQNDCEHINRRESGLVKPIFRSTGKDYQWLKVLYNVTIVLAISILSVACQYGLNREVNNLRLEATLAEPRQWNSVAEMENQSPRKANELLELVVSPQQFPELETLIQIGLQQNPSLQKATLAIQRMVLQNKLTGSQKLPSIDLSAGAGREKQYDGTASEATDNTYSSSLNVSWEWDLWRRIEDSLQRDEMLLRESRIDLQAAQDSLTAEVIRHWLSIIFQRQLIAIQQQRIAVLNSNKTIIHKRYRNGLGQLEDLDNATSSIESAQATLAEYNESLAAAQRSLMQTLGVFNSQPLPETQQFPEIIPPLVSQPSYDLARRPDLQALYYSVLSEQYAVRVAYKELLPKISLFASLSGSGTQPSEMLFKNPVWSLLGNLTAPLFDGGRLRAQAEIAELDLEQAYWNYRQLLLQAVYEVEQGISQEQSFARQHAHIYQALTKARRSAKHYQQKYRQGLADVLDLLTVQQQTFDLQIQLTEIIYRQLSNRIDLGLALGLGVSS